MREKNKPCPKCKWTEEMREKSTRWTISLCVTPNDDAFNKDKMGACPDCVNRMIELWQIAKGILMELPIQRQDGKVIANVKATGTDIVHVDGSTSKPLTIVNDMAQYVIDKGDFLIFKKKEDNSFVYKVYRIVDERKETILLSSIYEVKHGIVYNTTTSQAYIPDEEEDMERKMLLYNIENKLMFNIKFK